MIHSIAEWMREYLVEMIFAWMATMLVVYGREISRFFKKVTRKYHLVFRVLIFIVISAFGYGWLTNRLTQFLKNELAQCQDLTLVGLVITAFLLLGFLADKKNQV